MSVPLPCLLYEDEHLLAVNKPPGLNTHSPAPYAGEGIYDWLRHREPRWSALAIIHRLDKETSGVLVFAKSPLANRSLTEQFTRRHVRKQYFLLTDRPVPGREFSVSSQLVRLGDRYLSRPSGSGVEAKTRFRLVERLSSGRFLVEAEPLTGRTHQIRVHAAERGFPILGDQLYGGTPAGRTCLHAARLTLEHPASNQELTLTVAPDFDLAPQIALREALVGPAQTDSYRLMHGAYDGWAGWYADRFGKFLLLASEDSAGLDPDQRQTLERWMARYSLDGAYHKRLSRQPGKSGRLTSSPQLLLGQSAPDEFQVLENGLHFAVRFQEGYSVGLFLDQRDNRRRLLVNHVAAGFPLFPDRSAPLEVLNLFAYTCGFSVCAAGQAARTTSIDLSRKYLDWGRRNFQLNQLDSAAHEFLYGDACDWMQRLARKRRTFDLIILDPPTFSRSKEHRTFQVERDYERLVALAVPLLKREVGVLFASTNAATLKPEEFLGMIRKAVSRCSRTIQQQHYAPQPPDFPISREEPAYLKTVWLRIP